MGYKFELTEADFKKICADRFGSESPMIRKRLLVVASKHISGRTNKKIAEDFGFGSSYVSKWLKVYNKQGLKGLYTNNYGTNVSELDNFSSILIPNFSTRPPHTLNEAKCRIEELTGLVRSPTQIRTFLKKHDFRYLKAGQIPANANTVEQKIWVETELTPRLKEAKDSKRHVFFMDASHFVLSTFLCFLWCRTRVFIKGSAGRNRINVLGAVDAVTKKVHTLINTTYVNAETVVEFLEQIRQIYTDKVITIVLVNARYQHCDFVKTAAKRLEIDLLFLPTYSPNLNIIERLWKLTKKELLYGEYYETPKKFHDAIKDFFTNINESKKVKIDTLLTLNFQYYDTETVLNYAA